MEIKIQSIRFDATEKLEAFVEKKVGKLEKSLEDIQRVEVQLKVIKPATAMNKETSLTVVVQEPPCLWIKPATHSKRGLTSVLMQCGLKSKNSKKNLARSKKK